MNRTGRFSVGEDVVVLCDDGKRVRARITAEYGHGFFCVSRQSDFGCHPEETVHVGRIERS